MSKEFQAIILWSANTNLLEEIHDYFKSDLKHVFNVKADQYIRYNILKSVYRADKNWNHNDPRTYMQSAIIVCFVEVDSIYGSFMKRFRCNLPIVKFKINKREKYSHLDFHTTDDQQELKYVIEAFNLKGKI